MRAKEEELRDLLRSARLILSFEEQPAEKPAIREAADRASLLAIANLAAERAVRLYAETHPRPTQVTQAQVAEMLSVSTRTVRNYLAAGRLKLNRCGRVPIEAVDKLRSVE
jgi:DNA-directed RNA polymerase specialized sigma24 family protein